MTQTNGKGSFTGVGVGATAAVAIVICCAAPALLAGGLLASVGAVAGNPLVITLGVAVVAGAVVVALVRHRRRTGWPPKGAPVATPDDEVGLSRSSPDTRPTDPAGRTP